VYTQQVSWILQCKAIKTTLEAKMFYEENLFGYLRSIIKNMRKILDKEILKFGMGHAEMRLLMMIYSSENCTQEELTSRLEVDRSNVGRSLQKLVNLGYVNRLKDQEDGRLYRVFLTKKGWAIKKPLFQIKHNIGLTIAKQVTEKEAKILIKLLSKVDEGVTEKNYNEIKNSNNFI